MHREAMELTVGQRWGSGWTWRWWGLSSKDMKFHERNGRDIDDIGFDRFEASDGSAKVIKYHNEQHPMGKREFR